MRERARNPFDDDPIRRDVWDDGYREGFAAGAKAQREADYLSEHGKLWPRDIAHTGLVEPPEGDPR